MAHYAYLDDNNIVVAVTVGKDENELIDGLDTETYYAIGTPYTVKRTSYNADTNGFRYNYAAIGYTYDPIDDAFISPMPECGHDELLLNDLKRWECANCEANFEQSRTTA
jgi:hypothetical protein